MRYFTPRFRIASMTGEQKELRSKIGGVPWGLPERMWPDCCGAPQKLLVQLLHEPPMLDLGAPGAVLHLFQCLECGGIDECGHDAVIAQRAQLGSGPVQIPDFDSEQDLGGPLIGEFWIDGWDEADDCVPAARLPEFFLESDLWALQDEFPEINWFDSRERTRFGGTPRWTGNGPIGFPPAPFEYLFQLDNRLYLEGHPPSADEAGCRISEYSDADGQSDDSIEAEPNPEKVQINAPWRIIHERSANRYMAEYTNLGSDGSCYVFIDRTQVPHGIKWFWNR